MNTDFILSASAAFSALSLIIAISVLMKIFKLIRDVGKEIDTTTIKQMALIQSGCAIEAACIGFLSIFGLLIRQPEANLTAGAAQLPFFMVGYSLRFLVLYHYLYIVSDRCGIRIRSVPLSCVTSPTSKLNYWRSYYTFYVACVVVSVASSEVSMYVGTTATTAIQLVCVEGTNFLIGIYLIKSAFQFHKDSTSSNRYGSLLQLFMVILGVIQLVTCFCGKATSLSFKIAGNPSPEDAINAISGLIFSGCFVMTSIACGMLTTEIRATLMKKESGTSSLYQ